MFRKVWYFVLCFCIQDNWEIVEGLRGGLSNVQEPEKQAGYMLKKRKWPMKGWHKVCVSATVVLSVHLTRTGLGGMF